jgi:hypothetical protein
MGKKLNTEKFISKAILLHGHKYDYSLVDYKNCMTKVKIICPIHGIFEQGYQKHCELGRGCWECGKVNCIVKDNKDIFISKAIAKHGNKYDYSKVEYKSSKTKVIIFCKLHGDFLQQAGSHLTGSGCKECGVSKTAILNTLSKEEILLKFRNFHGDKYKYPDFTYKNTKSKISIVCKEHGEFKQTIGKHFMGGCKKCGDISTGNAKRILPKDLEKFSKNIRRRIKHFISSKGFTKKSPTNQIIGITWEKLKEHLENNPYGFKINDNNLDLDHIVPISSAKTEEDIYKLNHWTNFQLLPRKYNRDIKRAKDFDKKDFEKWLKNNKSI